MQHSARATARPPSLQSWALLMTLPGISERRASCNSLPRQIAPRRRTGLQAVQRLQVSRSAEAQERIVTIGIRRAG